MRRPVKPNELQFVAEQLGFILRVTQSSHWQFKKDGVGNVTIPRYSEIGDDIFNSVCRQMKITKKSFWKILDQHKKKKS